MMKHTDLYWNDLQKIQTAIPNLSELKNKNILITGAGGLIASALVDFLISLNDTCKMNVNIYAAARSKEKIQSRFQENFFAKIYIFFPIMQNSHLIRKNIFTISFMGQVRQILLFMSANQ